MIAWIRAHCLIPAVGVTAFAWGVAEGPFGVTEWIVFSAMVWIYNFDAARADAADEINLPERVQWRRRYAQSRQTLIMMAILSLIAAMIYEPRLVAPVILGGCGSLAYSLPVLSVRIKDLPAIKTVFPACVLTAAVLGPRVWLGQATLDLQQLIWCFCFLLVNISLFDVRDRRGDAQTGVRSVAVLLGPRRTLGLLLLLVGALAVLSWDMQRYRLATGLLAAAVAYGAQRPRSWLFYELAVDGLLFAPALHKVL